MLTNKKKDVMICSSTRNEEVVNTKKKEPYRKLTQEALSEGKQLSEIFAELSEIGKMMAVSYVSALRDKEASESQKAG